MSWEDDIKKKFGMLGDISSIAAPMEVNDSWKQVQTQFDTTKQAREIAEKWAEEASTRYEKMTGLLSGIYPRPYELGASASPYIHSRLDPQWIEWAKIVTPATSDYSVPNKRIVDEIDNLTEKKKKKERELEEIKKSIAEEKIDAQREEKIKAFEQRIQELTTINDTLENKLKFYHLREQISDKGKQKLDADPSFAERFSVGYDENCFVMSLDIRRSTELMLKAKSAKHFEFYIRSLCEGFRDIILSNNGVFDKFTGDGVLAYFPEFYSGPDAGYFAIRAAIDCHIFFKAHYQSKRNLFHVVLQNTGLGIGIDCGEIHLALINNYTVVGRPVVYACRLSSACTDLTLINQTAHDVLSERHKDSIVFIERPVSIKHEEPIIAYEIAKYPEDFAPYSPDWYPSDTPPPESES